FTELIVERCAPNEVRGIDPSEAQLDFARKRSAARLAKFDHGDAMALPFPADTFDVAIMALVIFFVPDPAKGVAEMTRVARPGGAVAAYAWDILGGGFTLEPLRIELREMTRRLHGRSQRARSKANACVASPCFRAAPTRTARSPTSLRSYKRCSNWVGPTAET
ncbi:MAG: class I SAM-dependent methyltransferase, partial [Pseudolabrys sp.]